MVPVRHLRDISPDDNFMVAVAFDESRHGKVDSIESQGRAGGRATNQQWADSFSIFKNSSVFVPVGPGLRPL
jgi:hypothetical protein